jgi:hypothetical protein
MLGGGSLSDASVRRSQTFADGKPTDIKVRCGLGARAVSMTALKTQDSMTALKTQDPRLKAI